MNKKDLAILKLVRSFDYIIPITKT